MMWSFLCRVDLYKDDIILLYFSGLLSTFFRCLAMSLNSYTCSPGSGSNGFLQLIKLTVKMESFKSLGCQFSYSITWHPHVFMRLSDVLPPSTKSGSLLSYFNKCPFFPPTEHLLSNKANAKSVIADKKLFIRVCLIERMKKRSI